MGWRGYLISFAGVVAIVAWNVGVHRLGAPNAALCINFIPITAFVWEVVAGRPFSAVELAGAGLVVVVAIGLNLYHRRVSAAASTNETE